MKVPEGFKKSLAGTYALDVGTSIVRLHTVGQNGEAPRSLSVFSDTHEEAHALAQHWGSALSLPVNYSSRESRHARTLK